MLLWAIGLAPLVAASGVRALGVAYVYLAAVHLTASGIVFQLRRGQVRGFVAGVRATLAEWD